MASLDDTIMLLKQSLYELADSIGDSLLEPKSLSLLCLTFEVPWDCQSKLMVAFRKLSQQDFGELSEKEIISEFRKAMVQIVPQAEEFSDLTVFSFIRVMAKNYVEELYPLSCDLQDAFETEADLEN